MGQREKEGDVEEVGRGQGVWEKRKEQRDEQEKLRYLLYKIKHIRDYK